jgi:small subunit ribosomal protein S20
MPIKKSAKKYMRITVSKTAKNSKIKGLFRSAIKKTREASAKGSAEDAKTWLKKSLQALDKAAEKNVISKNTAARKKSRLNRFVKNTFVKK